MSRTTPVRNRVQWSRHEPGVLPGWVAEMDYPTAAPVREAVAAAVLRDRLSYPEDHERRALAAACAGWLHSAHGWQVPAERVHIVPGVLRGLQVALDVGDPAKHPVIVPTPAYPPLFDVVADGGRRVAEVPMTSLGGRPVLDLDGIDRAFRSGARTLLLCNPHNPLGRVFTEDELTALAALVQRHRARVVSDEVHAPLTHPQHRHVPYAGLPGAAEHTLTVLSASKGWNLAGLACAQVVVANDADQRAWLGLPKLRTWGAATLGIVAGTAAYTSAEQWRADVLARLVANTRLLGDCLADRLPEVRFRAPEGTYLAWLDFRALGLPAEPAEFLLPAARVALAAGWTFGRPGSGHARLSFATTPDVLTGIVEAVAAALGCSAHRRPVSAGPRGRCRS